ncbi:LuxR C-terminal-related transcriptional regulator [Microbacterium pygmaeum]|uniref:LuxR C-terminal-related transcriptional regulator n=1 Tax=Microbacterium pygmaeum TaxID=370764 RepID=UPI0038B3DB76
MPAEGASSERMSARLGVVEKTVRNYLSGMYPKLDAVERVTAATAARDYLARHKCSSNSSRPATNTPR